MPFRAFGLDFEPYVDGQDPRLQTPISRAQMEARMRLVAPYTDWIRTYRTTDGFEVAGQVAHQLGLKAALGAWIGPEKTEAGRLANERNVANLIAAALAGDADLLIVGSETMHRNDLPVDALLGYLRQVRAAVPASLPVSTADVFGRFYDNPQVMDACDVLLVNMFPYWEGEPSANALANLHRNFHNTTVLANGKPVWISETGWPSGGRRLGAAIPSGANAAAFFTRLVSWSRAHDVPYFYFEAIDETWKASTDEGAVGKHWGVWKKGGALKKGMEPVFVRESYPVDWNAVIDGPGTPTITIIQVPPIGSGGHSVSGAVSHVAPFDVLITMYIHADGGWWGPKPYPNRPYTAVGPSGTWTAPFATAGLDRMADELAAFLLPTGTLPPLVLGEAELPASLAAGALATGTARRR